MMYATCLFVVGLLLHTEASGTTGGEAIDDMLSGSPGERTAAQIAEALREIVPSLQKSLVDMLVQHDDDLRVLYDELVDVLEAGDTDHEQYVDCMGCRFYVGGLMTLIDQGLNLDQIKPVAMEVCYLITNNNNWRGDLICDGIIDNYGPHVLYVLNTTELNAHGVCVKHRVCPESTERKVNMDFFGHHVEKPKARPDRPLDEMIKVLHLTDIHVDEEYMTGAAIDCGMPICCRDKYNGTGSAIPWGEKGCHLPPRVLNFFLDKLAALEPDLMIYTGDNAPSAMWEETLESQIQTSTLVTNAIREHMPGVPAFPCIGNHETYPTNQYYGPLPATQAFNDAYFDMWQDLGGLGPEEEETIKTAGYFEKLLLPGLRLLSYNSNYGYTDNFYGILNEEDESWLKMVDFMENTFDMARANGEKILLIGHHPIGGRGTFAFYDRVIDDIITRNGDIIIIQGLGHFHSNGMKLSLDPDSGEARAFWMYTGSMVGALGHPTARMIYIDPDTYEPVDYDTIYLDVWEALEHGQEEPVMKLLYRASEEYNVTDVSAQSMMELTQRFETDDDLWHRYRFNRNNRQSEPGPCLGQCRYNDICNIRSTSYDKTRACLDQAAKLQGH